MSWRNVKLGDYCNITSSKRVHLSERVTTGIPFYCSKEIILKRKGEEVNNCDYISIDAWNSIKNKYGIPQYRDILLTTRGTIGVPYLYGKNDKFYFADGNLTWLKDFNEGLYPEYLYLWFNTKEGFTTIDSIAKGTAQKALSILGLKSIEIPLPPLETQKKITLIISAYDELIENNQKQIKLLEEAAQRLYKEWFVDLRFPGHENVKLVDGVPEGWEKVNIGSLLENEIGGGWGEEYPTKDADNPAYVIRGTDLYSITSGDFNNLPYRYHSKSSINSRLLGNGDIIFEVSGGSRTEGVGKTCLINNQILSILDNKVICASFCKKMRLKNIDMAVIVYNALRYLRATKQTEIYDKRSASSIVNFRWQDFLNEQTLLVPDDIIKAKANYIFSKFYDCIINKSVEIAVLKEARDRLLPRLMSGEIEVI